MELVGAILFMLSVVTIVYANIDDNFDIKIKEIELILNSPEARKRKYELFDMLHTLADTCSNYNQLSKLNRLLMRVYDL